MTITALQTAAAVGGTAAQVTLATKTTLQVGTTVIGIAAQLTNGARSGNPQKTIKIYIAVTPFSTLTTTTGPQQLSKQAQILEVKPDAAPAGVRVEESGPLPALGNTLFVWVEAPALDAAATVSISLVEL